MDEKTKKEWQEYYKSKSVTYKRAGNRCVEIHIFPDGVHQIYFYINSSEPMNCIPTTVENKKDMTGFFANLLTKNLSMGSGMIIKALDLQISMSMSNYSVNYNQD